MKVQVNRTGIRLGPDIRKVIPRFFNAGDERSRMLIDRILALDPQDAADMLHHVMAEFSGHYKDVRTIFTRHFDRIRRLLTHEEEAALSANMKLLIGSYFTMEYSLEAAALFNPSIVEAPDQSGTKPGETNVIVSFRAVGEGHISSLVFRRGKLDANGEITLYPLGKYLMEGTVTQQEGTNKEVFASMLSHKAGLSDEIRHKILDNLNDNFTYIEIELVLKTALHGIRSAKKKGRLKYDILSMVNTSYELHFPEESQLSERVIFPVTFTEKSGIEDARFIKFTEDDGSSRYLATYTAYDGSYILPHLIETRDFLHFKSSPFHGKKAINKNLALFPRKIKGKYAMLSRIDGMNNYIMFSDDLYLWNDAKLLQQPRYAWELVQIGNGGSPIETPEGWLIVTHGVGPMRKYCLGASLFDLDDPTKEIGRLKDPLLMPNEGERHGYVPNVVYTCGSMIHGERLVIPFAVSDYSSSFASVSLRELLDAIKG